MATSEGIPSSIDIEFLELNDNPYVRINRVLLGCTEEKWQEQERMANLEKEIDTNWGFCKESHNDNYDDVPDEY